MNGRPMSDFPENDGPDPLDKAYREAEALLDDAEARAARRARVLGAVAEQPAAPAYPPPAAAGRRWGGWLAAASVVGLSLLTLSQIYRPGAPPAPPPVVSKATVAPAPLTVAPPVAQIAVPPEPAAPRVRAAPAPATPVRDELRAFPASPVIPAPERQSSVLGGSAVQADGRAANVPSVGYSGGYAAKPAPAAPAPALAAPPPPPPPPPSPPAPVMQSPNALTQTTLNDRLYVAAAAGRSDEVKALLEQGAPVDAADADGDTALMKAVRADRPSIVRILRRHGASSDRRNQSGESARDLAAARNDPKLNRALGLGP